MCGVYLLRTFDFLIINIGCLHVVGLANCWSEPASRPNIRMVFRNGIVDTFFGCHKILSKRRHFTVSAYCSRARLWFVFGRLHRHQFIFEIFYGLSQVRIA